MLRIWYFPPNASSYIGSRARAEYRAWFLTTPLCKFLEELRVSYYIDGHTICISANEEDDMLIRLKIAGDTTMSVLNCGDDVKLV